MAGGLSLKTIWSYGALGFPLALLGYPLGIWLRQKASYLRRVRHCTEWAGVEGMYTHVY